jgi:hypothetical protein
MLEKAAACVQPAFALLPLFTAHLGKEVQEVPVLHHRFVRRGRGHQIMGAFSSDLNYLKNHTKASLCKGIPTTHLHSAHPAKAL